MHCPERSFSLLNTKRATNERCLLQPSLCRVDSSAEEQGRRHLINTRAAVDFSCCLASRTSSSRQSPLPHRRQRASGLNPRVGLLLWRQPAFSWELKASSSSSGDETGPAATEKASVGRKTGRQTTQVGQVGTPSPHSQLAEPTEPHPLRTMTVKQAQAT